MAKTAYGNLAAVFHHPTKGSVRLSPQPAFIDAMGKFEFFVHRKKGLEPSQIPAPATDRDSFFDKSTWSIKAPMLDRSMILRNDTDLRH